MMPTPKSDTHAEHRKQSAKSVNGIVLLNKPLHLSSNAALQRVKYLYHAKKAGHTGSLDPLATGMLPICLGEATKFSQYDLDSDKTYRATGLLGIKTSTGDVAGEVTQSVEHFEVSEADLLTTLRGFYGQTLQLPSMYSALKHKGIPLYQYARKGVVIERAARPIYIHHMELLGFDGRQFEIQVTCGKGTYIRNLVEDIGDELGVGAHVTKLHRLYTKGYVAQPMYTLEELGAMTPQQLLGCLLPVDTPVSHLKQVILTQTETMDLIQGKIIDKGTVEAEPQSHVRLYTEDNHFIGLGVWMDNHSLRAKRLQSTN